MGHALIDDAAVELGRHWVQPLIWLAGALAGAAMLRAGAQVFLGLADDYEHGIEEGRGGPLPYLGAIAALLVTLGAAVSVVPGLTQRVVRGADRFRDRAGYADRVLHGIPMKEGAHLPVVVQPTSTASLVYGSAALVFAIALAAFAVHRRDTARARVFEPVTWPLQQLQTGVVGDYVMWVVVGTAVLGGVWALTLR
jgi:hypothetical protein